MLLARPLLELLVLLVAGWRGLVVAPVRVTLAAVFSAGRAPVAAAAVPLLLVAVEAFVVAIVCCVCVLVWLLKL